MKGLVFAKIIACLLIIRPVFSQNSAYDTPTDERILSFESEITVDTTGMLTVVEKITVRAAGNEINRGIYRYLPRNRSINGQTVYVRNRFQSVRKNEVPEPYHTTLEGNSDVIYIGDKDVYLDPGIYTYEITYTSEKQIGFFGDFDELYWNVTGNDWVFPIDKVKAVVYLPDEVEILQHSCYTGVQGSSEKNCTVLQSTQNRISWEASNLGQREGLTIAVGFTPEVIRKPIPPSYLSNENVIRILSTMVGLLLLAMFFLWRKYGVDPEKPIVVPRFTPPDGVSPAAAGYVELGSFKNTMVTASLVNLAVKNFIRIVENPKKGLFGKRTFTLERVNQTPTSTLAPEERSLLSGLFAGNRKSVHLKGSYEPSIAQAVTNYINKLQKLYAPFHKKGANRWVVWILYGCITAVYFTFLYLCHKHIYIPSKWIGGIVLFVLYTLIFSIFTSVRTASTASWVWIISVGISAALVWVGLRYLNMELEPFLLCYLFLILGTNILIIFSYLIRQPTPELLQKKADLEGFSMYLKAAEHQLIRFHNPPEVTPAVFEKYLPYALVLGVDKIWGEKFERYLVQHQVDYQNHWYSGQTGRSFTSQMSGLGSSLTSTVMASSATSGGSGSSGGGSSGGGGGGGGGGGW